MKTFIAIFAIIFVLIAGCASIPQTGLTPDTHTITIRWSDGPTEEYTLPIEMPDPNDLVAAEPMILPFRHFCFVVGFFVAERDLYIYIFEDAGKTLLGLCHQRILSDESSLETYWIYELNDEPKSCTWEEQRQFLYEWCSV